MEVSDLLFQFVENLTSYGMEILGRYYSSYRGVVINNSDPEMQGRIIAKVPNVSGDDPLPRWIWPKAVAGPQFGIFHPPDVGAGVWVEFEHGDPEAPIYTGGWWAKETKSGSKLETPTDLQKNPPTRKGWYVTCGSGLMFDEEKDKEEIRLTWHRPSDNKYAYIIIDKNGTVRMENPSGTKVVLNNKSGKEGFIFQDKTGNMLTSTDKGWVLTQKDGTLIELKSDTATVMAKNLILSGEGLSVVTGGGSLGQGASEPILLGNKFMQWTLGFFQAVLTHTHPTSAPGAPTGVPIMPSAKPPDATLLSQKWKTA